MAEGRHAVHLCLVSYVAFPHGAASAAAAEAAGPAYSPTARRNKKRKRAKSTQKKICHFQRRPRLQHCTPSVSALLDLFQVSRDRCSSDQSHNALYSEHRENQCGLIASQYPVPCQVSNSLFSDNERFCSGNLNSVRVR